MLMAVRVCTRECHRFELHMYGRVKITFACMAADAVLSVACCSVYLLVSLVRARARDMKNRGKKSACLRCPIIFLLLG